METSNPAGGLWTTARVARTLLVILALMLSLLPLMPGSQPLHAAGGSYFINFAAADPSIYIPPIPYPPLTAPIGRGNGDTAIPNAYFIDPVTSTAVRVESLAPEDMALGQIVPFEIRITVSGSTSPENGQITFMAGWDIDTTSNSDFGYDEALGVIAAFVDTGDGANLDPEADATVDSFTWTVVGDEIQSTIDISGLDDGDDVVIEVWLVLEDSIPEGSTGNVPSRLISAETSEGDAISTGNQTVPLLRVQEFFTSDVDVSVTKSDNPDPVTAGEQLSYQVVVLNSGPAIANEVVVTDTLDPNTTFVSASASNGGTCTEAGGVITCDLGSIAPGVENQVTITIVVDVAEDAPTDGTVSTGTCSVGAPGVDLCNTVVVTTISDDTNPDNNSDSEPTDVLPPLAPGLAVVKTCTEDVFWCDDIQYQVTVTNTGDFDLVDVVVQDALIDLDETVDLAAGESRTFTAIYHTCPPPVRYTLYLPLVMRGASSATNQQQPSGSTPTHAAQETVVNTVTATSQYGSEVLTVSDSCTTNVHELTVSKDAQPGVVRTYQWTITKDVDDEGPRWLYAHDFVEPEYTVVVDLDDPPYIDGGWFVSGTITIDNPAPMDAQLQSVMDVVSPDIMAAVDCPSLTVPAGDSLICTYGPVELPDDSARTNTATATLINNNSNTTPFTGTASFDFSQPNLTEIDAEVQVSDSILGDLGTVRYDEVPRTFTYTGMIVATGEICELFEVENEAILVTNDTLTEKKATAVVQAFELCKVTVGYEDLPLELGNDWDYNDLILDFSPILEPSPEHDLLAASFTIFQELGAGPTADPPLTSFHHEAHLKTHADAFVCSGTYTLEVTIDGVTTTDTGIYQPGDDFTIIPDTADPPDLVELRIDFDVPPTGCPFNLTDFDYANYYHGQWLFFEPWLYVFNTAEEIHVGTTEVEPRILTIPVDWQWPMPDGNRICNAYPKVTGCVPGPPTFVPFWWDN